MQVAGNQALFLRVVCDQSSPRGLPASTQTILHLKLSILYWVNIQVVEPARIWKLGDAVIEVHPSIDWIEPVRGAEM